MVRKITKESLLEQYERLLTQLEADMVEAKEKVPPEVHIELLLQSLKARQYKDWLIMSAKERDRMTIEKLQLAISWAEEALLEIRKAIIHEENVAILQAIADRWARISQRKEG